MSPEMQELLDRWVKAIDSKDLDRLGSVFRREPDLVVFWSNGERSVGWDEARRHIDADLRQEISLLIDMQDARETCLGDDARVLTFRYEITLTVGEDSASFRRLASMAVDRTPAGWQIASLHVSTAAPSEPEG